MVRWFSCRAVDVKEAVHCFSNMGGGLQTLSRSKHRNAQARELFRGRKTQQGAIGKGNRRIRTLRNDRGRFERSVDINLGNSPLILFLAYRYLRTRNSASRSSASDTATGLI